MDRNGDGGAGAEGFPQACASCRHQRKRCDNDCDLAPFFPANRYSEFQNAHKLFSVSNIQKIMNSVHPHQRQAAADSILHEGNARRDDPVHGCLGAVRKLMVEIKVYETQLGAVNQQLELFRQLKKICNYEPLNLPDDCTLRAGEKRKYDRVYNYESTVEEGADVDPFDVKYMCPMEESYGTELALRDDNEPGELTTQSKQVTNCGEEGAEGAGKC